MNVYQQWQQRLELNRQKRRLTPSAPLPGPESRCRWLHTYALMVGTRDALMECSPLYHLVVEYWSYGEDEERFVVAFTPSSRNNCGRSGVLATTNSVREAKEFLTSTVEQFAYFPSKKPNTTTPDENNAFKMAIDQVFHLDDYRTPLSTKQDFTLTESASDLCDGSCDGSCDGADGEGGDKPEDQMVTFYDRVGFQNVRYCFPFMTESDYSKALGGGAFLRLLFPDTWPVFWIIRCNAKQFAADRATICDQLHDTFCH